MLRNVALTTSIARCGRCSGRRCTARTGLLHSTYGPQQRELFTQAYTTGIWGSGWSLHRDHLWSGSSAESSAPTPALARRPRRRLLKKARQSADSPQSAGFRHSLLSRAGNITGGLGFLLNCESESLVQARSAARLPRRLVDLGHDVVIANSRGPEEPDGFVAELGDRATAARSSRRRRPGTLWWRSRSALREPPAEPFVGRIVIAPTTTTSTGIHATPGWTRVRPRPANSSPPICRCDRGQGVQHDLVPAAAAGRAPGPARRQRLAIPIAQRRPGREALFVTALADELASAGGQRHPRRQPPAGIRHPGIQPAGGPEEAIALLAKA